jgi:nicotinate-nucleotide adenylyltransferase
VTSVSRGGRRPPRLGIFGGTFDPVHLGHLRAAAAVRVALDLDRVVLMVAGRPWQKANQLVTPAEDRYALVEAAAPGWEGLAPCRLELDREGETYTLDTVRALADRCPGARLVLVVGSDVMTGLPTWHDWQDLARLVELAVVTRPGSPAVAVPDGWRASIVPVATPAVSSTDLRARLQAGTPVGDVVPDAVMRRIAERGLYATGR